jgi:hypothetical protein
VLVAGGLGVLAFFVPFVEVHVLDDVATANAVPANETPSSSDREPPPRLVYMRVPVSAYRYTVGYIDSRDAIAPKHDCIPTREQDRGSAPYICNPRGHSAETLIPYYFLSTLTLLLAGGISIWRKRMSGFAGLATLAASLFAIGCWLHGLNSEHHLDMDMAIGATFLGVSGLLALGPAIAVLYWREPEPKPLFKIRLPVARLLRR